MLIDDSKRDLKRRVKEARGYADQISPFMPMLAATIRGEADDVAALIPALNRDGRIRSNGLLHGLSYAAVIVLEERKLMK